MSDPSDNEDGLASDAAESLHDEESDESDESETDRGNGLLDLEAEESDGYDEDEDEDEDEDGYENERDHRRRYRCPYHFSFPKFSHLPTELRAMIWEIVDPYLKSKGRVLALNMMKFPQPDLWESALLADQTASARALLATCKESRGIALKHYPNAVRIRRGAGEVRFNSSNDIILLHPREQQPPDVRNFAPWLQQVKFLGFDYSFAEPFSHDDLFPGLERLVSLLGNLRGLFCCFQGYELKDRHLEWSTSESSKLFYLEVEEDLSYAREELKMLYAWPDPNIQQNVDDSIGAACVLQFPALAAIDAPHVWPLVEYSFDSGLKLYEKIKRRRERRSSREAGDDAGSTSSSSPESSDGESFWESASDDYDLDGFVVDNSSEGSEESDEDGSLSDGDIVVDDSRIDEEPDVFNGFSPLEEDLSHDEATGDLQRDTPTNYDSEEIEESNLPHGHSLEEQPHIVNQNGRRKRVVFSSDDEDDGEAGDQEPIVEPQRRAKKRARVILSDSEGEDDRLDDGEAEGTARPTKRIRTVLSDSEDEGTEEPSRNERRRRPRPPPDSDEDEDADADKAEESDQDDDVTEDEDDDEDEEEPPPSKPMSLLARLRQFRSDVPVSPEAESPGHSEDYGQDEDDDEERRFSDAEFPDSAPEDDGEDEW
ncbi:hypothetical protein F5Y08DRAFT_312962 [Xylaria arbuscula]|nr:hypothetical protein F5Y08DRAFT_312962 [Xylaria arbuscula]